MRLAAQAAGHPEPELHTVGLHLERGLLARALHPRRRGRQCKHAAAGDHGLAALRADITKASHFLHSAGSFMYRILYIIPRRRAHFHPRRQISRDFSGL